ncbi:hypothetical protein KUTG_02849 [Kutzneria sp. 744]|nr:hypothetical protein KUTG_02849 [Kutzneria sp. 744]
MGVRVSVLDTSPIVRGSTAREALRNTLDLAVLADELGFHRYWVLTRTTRTLCQGGDKHTRVLDSDILKYHCRESVFPAKTPGDVTSRHPAGPVRGTRFERASPAVI